MARRRLLNLLCMASPLVFAAVLVLWVRSYYWGESFALSHGARDGSGQVVTHSIALMSSFGCVGVRAGRWREADSPQLRADIPDGLHGRHQKSALSGPEYPLSGSFWNRIGFHFDVDRYSAPGDTEHAFTLGVPDWLPLWLSATPSAGWALRRRRERLRRKAGLCPRCGYDVRATPDRCPECGVSVGPEHCVGATFV